MPVDIKKEPAKSLVIAAFAALYLIWGSTYLAILYAIQTIPPLFTSAMRFLLVGIILLGWCFAKGERLPSLRSICNAGIAGVLMLSVGNGAVMWAEQYLPSGLAAIIVATVPLWFVILDKRQWSYYFSNKWIIIGLLTGFAGVMFLFSGKGSVSIGGNKMKMISFIALTIGTIGWAIGSLYSKYKPSEGSTAMKVGWQMLLAGIASTIGGFVSGEQHGFHPSHISASSVWAMVYLVTVGSIIGYMSYIWLLSVRPPSLVGTYAYVNPVVAVFLGWAWVGEPVTTIQMIALAIILVGVIVVNFAKDGKTNTSKQNTKKIQTDYIPSTEKQNLKQTMQNL